MAHGGTNGDDQARRRGPARPASTPIRGAGKTGVKPNENGRLKAALSRATQPGVQFEVGTRFRGKVTAGDVAKLRQAAERGNKSAQKALNLLTQQKAPLPFVR